MAAELAMKGGQAGAGVAGGQFTQGQVASALLEIRDSVDRTYGVAVMPRIEKFFHEYLPEINKENGEINHYIVISDSTTQLKVEKQGKGWLKCFTSFKEAIREADKNREKKTIIHLFKGVSLKETLNVKKDNLTIEGFCAGNNDDTMLSIITGTMTFEGTGITFNNVKLISKDNRPCIKCRGGTTSHVTLNYCHLLRKETFNTTLYAGSINRFQCTVKTYKPGWKAPTTAAVVGGAAAVGGYAIGGVVMGVGLTAAAGTAGPATVILGAGLLGASAATGIIVFIAIGAGIGAGIWFIGKLSYNKYQERLARKALEDAPPQPQGETAPLISNIELKKMN